jgi:acyl-CoA synthetase (NDP forming)
MNPTSQNILFSKALLNPDTIALVGASGDVKKNTARPLRFMKKHAFSGRVFPVNPTRSEIDGQRCYASVTAAPEPVEHVFVMVPGEQVMSVLDDCAQAGAKVITIYSDGFAESGQEGLERQNRLVHKARSLGMRVLGPNSIGTANIQAGSIISVNAAFEADNLVPGDISLVSQSGSMMGSFLSRAAARGFGFAKSVSVGNEADITVGEVVNALVDDEQTKVILLFLETLRDPYLLRQAVIRARQAGKPVIAYKLGRSDQGNQLAQSHTGAMAGSDSAVDAFLKDVGIMRVRFLETLFELVPLALTYADAPVPENKPRVAVITTTGGGAATVVDAMGLMGLEAVEPPASFVAHMADRGLKIKPSAVIDLTLAATSAQYQDLLEQILQSDWCDAVLSVVGSSAQFHPELAVRPIIQCRKSVTKPLAVFLAPDAPESLQLLRQNAVAAFRTPEGCADALSTFLHRPRAVAECPSQSFDPFAWPLADSTEPGLLSEFLSTKVMKALGIAFPNSALVSGADQHHTLAYPVVAKICSPDLPHKTDAGGIRTNIRNATDLADSIQEILLSVKAHAPCARVDGILVQEMEPNLLELILGYRFDPLVGPTVLLGAGGIAAELNRDYSLRLAPVSVKTAHEMIDEVRLTKLVRGYRGLPEGDMEALARAISDFSRLALVQGAFVTEAEINPLFVQPGRVIGVDALVTLGVPTSHERALLPVA